MCAMMVQVRAFQIISKIDQFYDLAVYF